MFKISEKDGQEAPPLLLFKPSKLHGTVVDGDGKPQAGAEVSAFWTGISPAHRATATARRRRRRRPERPLHHRRRRPRGDVRLTVRSKAGSVIQTVGGDRLKEAPAPDRHVIPAAPAGPRRRRYRQAGGRRHARSLATRVAAAGPARGACPRPEDAGAGADR